MDVTQTVPGYNPADTNTLDGMNNMLFDKIGMNIECCIPAIVQSYDISTNRATVKPAITGVASQGQKVSKPAYVNIPVRQNPYIKIPIKTGDTGWLIASDRNISIFKQSLTESAPNDFRKHKFEDGFFLPDSINCIGVNDVTITKGTQNLIVSDADITATNFKALNGATGSIIDSNGKKLATVQYGIVTEIF